jgi:hypothetical protein
MESRGKSVRKEKKNEYLEGVKYMHNHWDDVPPVLKGVIYVVAGVAVLWASKFVFSAIGGAVGSFRGMVKSFRE